MSADLRVATAEYLEQRRSRGYKLREEGALLLGFAEALHARGVEQISVADALAFAQHDPDVSRANHARRLSVIRGFVAWLRATDPAAAEPIPQGLIRASYQRINPYLYSPAQVDQLMAATRNLREPFLAEGMYILIGLLYVTGLRSGEAFALAVEDFDAARLVLSVRGKLDRQRLVPLHPSAAEELSRYCASRRSGPLLVGRDGQRLAPHRLRRVPSFGGQVRAHPPTRCPSGQAARFQALPGRRLPRPVPPRGPRRRRTGCTPVHLLGPQGSAQHLLVSHRQPRAHVRRVGSHGRRAEEEVAMTALAPTLQSWFTEYLIGQRGASPNTVAAYRDCMRLLVSYAHESHGVRPAELDFAHLDDGTVAGFLDMLEHKRHASVATRNARLAAVHSLFSYSSFRHPEHAELIARVLAIPSKAASRSGVVYLDDAEVDAFLAAPDRQSWSGQRDHAWLLLMIITGIRVGELVNLRRADLCAGRPAHIVVTGKGRKQRIIPLDKATAATLASWTRDNPAPPEAPLFATRGRGGPMSGDAVAQRVALHASRAAGHAPSLKAKTVTPHALRHTCAMRMLASGLDITTIALWLGHSSPAATRHYLHADLGLKQRALERTAPPRTRPGRYAPTDKVLAFLEAL